MQSGYLYVTLYNNGKRKDYRVHRLILSTFNPREDMDKLQVNHKDEDKTNNHLSNLEWCTQKENINYGTALTRAALKNHEIQLNHKAKSKQVLCVELNKIFPSLREVERQLGVNHADVSKVCNGKQKTAGGYHWQFITKEG